MCREGPVGMDKALLMLSMIWSVKLGAPCCALDKRGGGEE